MADNQPEQPAAEKPGKTTDAAAEKTQTPVKMTMAERIAARTAEKAAAAAAKSSEAARPVTSSAATPGASPAPVTAPRAMAASSGGRVAPRASAASHLSEVALLMEQAQRLAVNIDAGKVRRSYRNWISWILGRSRGKSVCIAVVPGARKDAWLAELDVRGGMADEPIFELHGANQIGHVDRPWPRLHSDALPQEVTVVLINEPDRLANEWDTVGTLRRDCVAAIACAEAGQEMPTGVFDRLPIGLLYLADEAAAGKPRLSVRDAAAHAYEAALPAGTGLIAAIGMLFPPALREPMRAAVMSSDLSALGNALQAEEDAGQATAGMFAAAETARSRRSEADRLSSELDQLVAARNDFSNEAKAVLASLRQQRSEIESGSLVEDATSAPFQALVDRFDPNSREELEGLVSNTHKRTWWEGTHFAIFRGFFSKKSEAQLREEVLTETLEDVRQSSLRWLSKVTVEQIGAFNRAVDNVGISYFGGNNPLAAFRAEKVFADNFVTGLRPPPGGAPPVATIARQMTQSAESAFRGFAAHEVRAFRIEREKRGFIGQVTEARSAVFGVYFLLLMSVRLVPSMECETTENGAVKQGYELACWVSQRMNYDLRLLLMGLIVLGFMVNIFSHPRQERAMLADKVQAKLEELRMRLTSFLDRFLKDQLSLLETTLNDQTAATEAALERLRATAQAKLDVLRASAPSGRSERAPPARPVQIDETTRKLAAKVRTDFHAEYLQAFPA